MAEKAARLIKTDQVLSAASMLIQDQANLKKYIIEGGRMLSANEILGILGYSEGKNIRSIITQLNTLIAKEQGDTDLAEAGRSAANPPGTPLVPAIGIGTGLGMGLDYVSYEGIPTMPDVQVIRRAFLKARKDQNLIDSQSPAQNSFIIPALELVQANANFLSPINRVSVSGRLGWGLVASGKYKAAIKPLQDTLRFISDLPEAATVKDSVKVLKMNTLNNLGIAHFRIGECTVASKYLKESSSLGNQKAAQTLMLSCRDSETGELVNLQ